MHRKRNILCYIIIISLCFSLIGGCGSPYKTVHLNPVKLFEAKGENAVNSSRASLETQQTLRLLFMDKAFQKDHQKVIAELEQMIRKEPTPALRMALAELSLLEARKMKEKDIQKIVYYLVAAEQAYDYLFFDTRTVSSSPLMPSFRFMADIYNLAVSELVSLRTNRRDKWESKDFEYGGVQYHFQVAKEGTGIWDPSIFTYLHNSYEIRVTGLANEYITRGIGAPLVGIIENPAQNPHFGQYFRTKILSYPVSAMLLFDPVKNTGSPSRDIRLVFYDSLMTDSVAIQNQTVPLEADFTTPLGLQLGKIKPFELGLEHLLQSDVELKNAGIRMLEPYRPDKIPVVMIHGLLSTPATWAPMFNDLRGDAELRKKYQFWFFMYPSGLPIGYSTSILRNQLKTIHDEYDPNSTNPNFNQMVLIGHSMGGLLSRGMVQDSGTLYWDTFFTEPYEKSAIDPNTKELLRGMMFFEHLSFVKRVIFIATPHRGSPMADHWYTNILSGMVNLPSIVSDTVTSASSKGTLTSTAASVYTKKAPNSLMLLSPSSMFIKATNTIPLRPDIPYHSIIGTRTTASVGAGTSDGVVPYESSHLDFTVSEKMVPSNHGAHEHPLAIDEVKRILREHLAQINRESPSK